MRDLADIIRDNEEAARRELALDQCITTSEALEKHKGVLEWCKSPHLMRKEVTHETSLEKDTPTDA